MLERRMTGHPTRRIWLLRFVVAAFLVGGGVHAQSLGPSETITPQGTVMQKFALTPAQKSAIYNAVLALRVRTATRGVPVTVGAPVPPSVALSDLPAEALSGQDTANDTGGNLLKYAMVEDEVVVIDPIQMRVVDVIHGGAISGTTP
jgi:Protein of unknown function (DUF1236)